MSRLLIRVLVTSIAELCLLCPSPNVRLAGATPPPPGNWSLVWSDEFNGTELDIAKWGHQQPGEARGGRNSINSPAAVSVAGGKLVMRTFTPLINPTTPPHHAGIIQTGVATPGECTMPLNELDPPGNKHTPLYGYIEASIDFDGESGMWHSFFVQTPNNLLQGPLDEHLRGMEMDIVEHKKMEGSTNRLLKKP